MPIRQMSWVGKPRRGLDYDRFQQKIQKLFLILQPKNEHKHRFQPQRTIQLGLALHFSTRMCED